MRATEVEHVVLQAMPGAALNDAIFEGIKMSADQQVDVVVKYNSKRYLVDHTDLLELPKEITGETK